MFVVSQLDTMNLMDTEIVDYHGEEYSLQAFADDPDSVLFPMHDDSSSSERLQEIGVTNSSVAFVSRFPNKISILI